VFSTVGFGDIVPTAGLTRVLAMAQMIGDVVVVGLVVRVMIAAMRQGLKRQSPSP
jgi:voltage-gated potassium channel